MFRRLVDVEHCQRHAAWESFIMGFMVALLADRALSVRGLLTAWTSGWTRINAGRLIADKLLAIQRLLDRGLLSVRIRAIRYCAELWDGIGQWRI